MKFIKPLSLLLLLGLLLGSAVLVGMYYYYKPELPSVEVLKDVRLQTPMRIYTADGKLISQYGVKRRIPVKLEQVPDILVQAILATEDSRFYQHPGIDPIGMTRALVNLLVTGEKGQGGSTLTMQLARGFFLSREKTYIRKIKEIFIAWHIEQTLSKEEILELYINKVELGHRAFGFGAAAQVYYGKSLAELNLAQLATLAGLPQAPSVLNPISGPERSMQRRRIVLARMLAEGYIDRPAFEQASSAPVSAKKHGAEIELDAPYLADVIYQEMIALYGKEEAETGGYQIYATAPSNLQLAAKQAVQDNLYAYDERHGFRGPVGYLWQTPDPQQQSIVEPVAAEKASLPLPAEPISESDILAALQNYSGLEQLEVAAVVEVAEQQIQVLQKNGQRIQIDWDGLKWARPYISDSRQGADPKTAADIVAPGALVWIRQQSETGLWQLSQIPQASGALVALEPMTGAVQAVVGGFSFYQSQFNRVTQAKRQIGSNIKPFVYSAALENGYTLASVINDAPIHKDEGDGKAWRPQNSPPVYDGPIRMRVALGRSKNVVSVRLLRGVGVNNVVDYLTRFGLQKDDIPFDETISIGSSSHTPLEVAAGISVIANGGFYLEPYFIARIDNQYGETLWQAKPPRACDPCQLAEAEIDDSDIEAMLAAELNAAQQDEPEVIASAQRVISEQNAFLVAEMMRTAVRSNGNWNKGTYWLGTGWRARNILKRADIHGKTGTTNDSRDAWFSGFAGGLVATAWVGFDDMNRELGRTEINHNLINQSDENNWIGNAVSGAEEGAKSAQPAWIRFMRSALKDKSEVAIPVPADMLRVRIDRGSGKLTKRTDHTAMFEYFVRGSEPSQFVRDQELVDLFTGQDEPQADEIF